MTHKTAFPNKTPYDAGAQTLTLRRLRSLGRTAFQQSLMMAWVITPLLPVIAAVVSWCLGL